MFCSFVSLDAGPRTVKWTPQPKAATTVSSELELAVDPYI